MKKLLLSLLLLPLYLSLCSAQIVSSFGVVVDEFTEVPITYAEIGVSNDWGYIEDFVSIYKEGDDPIRIDYKSTNTPAVVLQRSLASLKTAEELGLNTGLRLTGLTSRTATLPINCVAVVFNDDGIDPKKVDVRKMAKEIHDWWINVCEKPDPIRHERTTVLVSKVRDTKTGKVTIYVSVSGGSFDGKWREWVKEKYGADVVVIHVPAGQKPPKGKGHAEQVKIDHLNKKYDVKVPEGGFKDNPLDNPPYVIDEWGVAWSKPNYDVPCKKCQDWIPHNYPGGKLPTSVSDGNVKNKDGVGKNYDPVKEKPKKPAPVEPAPSTPKTGGTASTGTNLSL